ncbi:hypothetical protein OXX69_000823 [Metschnikowia pulcherrima]
MTSNKMMTRFETARAISEILKKVDAPDRFEVLQLVSIASLGFAFEKPRKRQTAVTLSIPAARALLGGNARSGNERAISASSGSPMEKKKKKSAKPQQGKSAIKLNPEVKRLTAQPNDAKKALREGTTSDSKRPDDHPLV